MEFPFLSINLHNCLTYFFKKYIFDIIFWLILRVILYLQRILSSLNLLLGS